MLAGTAAGLGMGGAFALLTGFSGFLLGFVPAVAGGVTAGVLNLPVRGNRDGSFHTSRPARRTFVIRAGVGLISLVGAVGVVTGACSTAPSSLHALLIVLTLAVVLGVWLPRFGVSMHGWWSHRTALKAIVEYKYAPRDLEKFLKHAEERIVMRRSLTGHMFLHRTLQSYLVSGPAGRSKSWTDSLLLKHVFPREQAVALTAASDNEIDE